MRVLSSALGVGAIVLVAGCGASQPPPARSITARPAIEIALPFPSRQTVEKHARAAVTPLPRREVAATRRWRVEAAPAAPLGLESRFSDVAFTKELRCVAREYGRLRAETGVAQPDERLERFILGACGVTAARVATSSWKIEAPSSASDDVVFGALDAKSVRQELRDLEGRPAGLWLVRKDREAILTLVTPDLPERDVTATLADSTGHVTIQGSADVASIGARINLGRDGSAPCERDATIPRPRFRFVCTMAPGDRTAWIEVRTLPPRESALVDLHARVLARRDLTSAVELEPTTFAASHASSAEAKQVLLERLNRIRQSARLRPLTFASKQSDMNDRVASQFFRLGHEHHRDASDEIARGLVAGWDVDSDGGKLIRSGSFYGSLLSDATSVESWLEAALESPFGRYKLLGPDADELAIGIAPASDVGGMGVIVTTYDFFDENSRAADEAAVYKRLDEVRAWRKLPPVTSLPPMPVFDEELRLVRAGKRNPREVTDIVLAHETRRLQRPLVGAFSLTHDLAGTTITRYLLGQGPLSVRAAVTIYKPEGSPWGYYAVYIISSLPDEAAALLDEER